MVFPNFLIIGAAKAATTSLASLIEQHPEAGIVRGKEPHYFSYDNHYALGWERYQELYQHIPKDRKAVGDASTSYSRIRMHPKVIERISRHLEDPKIIYMVRHPLKRIESAYIEHCSTLTSPAFSSINIAVQRMPIMVNSSRYWEVFDAYRRQFGEKNIKIVWFEEYVKSADTIYEDICSFLGISEDFKPDHTLEKKNTRSHAKSKIDKLGRSLIAPDTTWDPAIRLAVTSTLKEDNLRFLEHFGKSSDYWEDTF